MSEKQRLSAYQIYGRRPAAVKALHDDILMGSVTQSNARAGDATVISITGPLTQHSTMWGDSYESILARFEEACKDDSHQILMRISSPGGDAAGVVELGRALRAMADSAKKPVTAYVDEEAYSAAYAIAVAADRIVIPATGGVGSVGCIAFLVDESAALDREGVKIRVVRSGPQKTLGTGVEPITDPEVAEAQTRVDSLAKSFADWVGERRGKTGDDVLALQGALLYGHDAISKGLADEIGSWYGLLTPSPEAGTKAATANGGGEKSSVGRKVSSKGLSKAGSRGKSMKMGKVKAETTTVIEETSYEETVETDEEESAGSEEEAPDSEPESEPEMSAEEMRAEIARLRAAQAKASVQSLVSGAIKAGKILPAQRAAFEQMSEGALKTFLAASKPVVSSKQAQPAPRRQAPAAVSASSQTARDVCEILQCDPDQFQASARVAASGATRFRLDGGVK